MKKNSDAVRAIVFGLLATSIVLCILVGVALTIVRIAINAVGV